MSMELSFLKRHPFLQDAINIVIFVVCVVIGTFFINTFIFRSFSVVGPSMEKTLYTGDRLIVNRIPITVAQIQGKAYVPERGEIIVFKNPKFSVGIGDEFIVKRVIAFTQYQYLPGETYESNCDCTSNENSFGLNVGTYDFAKGYLNLKFDFIIKCKVYYKDIGRIVHDGDKVRCCKITVLD